MFKSYTFLKFLLSSLLITAEDRTVFRLVYPESNICQFTVEKCYYTLHSTSNIRVCYYKRFQITHLFCKNQILLFQETTWELFKSANQPGSRYVTVRLNVLMLFLYKLLVVLRLFLWLKNTFFLQKMSQQASGYRLSYKIPDVKIIFTFHWSHVVNPCWSMKDGRR